MGVSQRGDEYAVFLYPVFQIKTCQACKKITKITKKLKKIGWKTFSIFFYNKLVIFQWLDSSPYIFVLWTLLLETWGLVPNNNRIGWVTLNATFISSGLIFAQPSTWILIFFCWNSQNQPSILCTTMVSEKSQTTYEITLQTQIFLVLRSSNKLISWCSSNY